jgi:hypothetical protein
MHPRQKFDSAQIGRVPFTASRYRVVPRADILQGLAVCWSYEAQTEGQEFALAKAEEALAELHALGLPFAPEGGGPLRYDPCEVMNTLKVAGDVGLSATWDRCVANGRRMIRELGGVSRSDTPRHFRVTLRRDFNARELHPGRAARLRLPGPLLAATQKSRVTVRALDGLKARIGEGAPGRLEVVVPPDRLSADLLAIEASIDLDAAPEGGSEDRRDARPLSDEERRLYTAGREGLIVVSPKIRAYAKERVGKARADHEILERLWTGVRELEFGHIQYDALDPVDPLAHALSTRWVNCHLGAALLSGLCRASGIPARVVGGFCLYAIGPYYHYWTEVYLERRGWIPVDLAGLPLARRPEDPSWLDVFFGRLDQRLKIECFPRVFTGHVGVRMPPEWYMVTKRRGNALQRCYHRVHDGGFLYGDTVSVELVARP